MVCRLCSRSASISRRWVTPRTSTSFRARQRRTPTRSPRTPDGRWDIEPAGTAEFTTRIVVYRPNNPARGNGTVIVEWLNVTGGLDIPAIWMPTHRHLVREGYTWVGVSVQQVGIDGKAASCPVSASRQMPDRYGALASSRRRLRVRLLHARRPRGARRACPIATALPIDRVIAVGASQSAFHLTTYVNAIDPRGEVFDGYLLQGRAGAGAPIDGLGPGELWSVRGRSRRRARARLAGPRPHSCRRACSGHGRAERDRRVGSSRVPARPPTRQRALPALGGRRRGALRHVLPPRGRGRLRFAPRRRARAALVVRADTAACRPSFRSTPARRCTSCCSARSPALDHWVRHGTEPPVAARLEIDADGGLGVDDLGVGRGGVRTPWVDVPAVVVSGLGPARRHDGAVRDHAAHRRPPPHGAVPGWPRRVRRASSGRPRATRSTAGFLLAADTPEIEALGAAAWPE